MADLTTAFWGMTINNYTETDLALVQNGYPDHLRELVHTLEEGEDGTPHIQAWIKLKRQQRLSFLKKLFPRGHFKALCSAEYQQNTKAYAQKLDGTARGAAIHRFNDPIHTIEGIVRKVINRMIELDLDLGKRALVEREMVQEDYTMAKVFVSATYRQMFKQYGEDMYDCLAVQHFRQQEEAEAFLARPTSDTEEAATHTHTHTHVEHPFFSQRVSIPTIDGRSQVSQEQAEDSSQGSCEEDDEGDEDSSGSEGSSGTESDDSGCSESDVESED